MEAYVQAVFQHKVMNEETVAFPEDVRKFVMPVMRLLLLLPLAQAGQGNLPLIFATQRTQILAARIKCILLCPQLCRACWTITAAIGQSSSHFPTQKNS